MNLSISGTLGASLALAAAGLAGHVQAADAPVAKADLGHCSGVNACKGHNGCKTANNACKGQGGCKGQGFVAIPKATCSDVGGTVKS